MLALNPVGLTEVEVNDPPDDNDHAKVVLPAVAALLPPAVRVAERFTLLGATQMVVEGADTLTVLELTNTLVKLEVVKLLQSPLVTVAETA